MLQLSDQERRLASRRRPHGRSFSSDSHPCQKTGRFQSFFKHRVRSLSFLFIARQSYVVVSDVSKSEGPLYEVTAECAVSAAVSDPRFPPVRIEELEGLRFEISVLSVLQEVEAPDKLEVGRHGLLIEKGRIRGVSCYPRSRLSTVGIEQNFSPKRA